VAFYTLLERKVLGFIINRRGPNKPSICGLFIPFADALKLLTKPFIIPFLRCSFLLVFSVCLSFVIPSMLWIFISYSSRVYD